MIIKFVWASESPQIAKITLRKNKAGRIKLPDFKLNYKVTKSNISMEQNRKPRNEHSIIPSINLGQRKQEYTIREKTTSSTFLIS